MPRHAAKVRMSAFFIMLALLLAFLFWSMGLDKLAARVLLPFGVLGAFVAGLFYTIGFTTPTALVIIFDLMQLENAFSAAFMAALGAAVADSVLFYLIGRSLEKKAENIMKKIRGRMHRLSFLFPFLGFLVFGSPLPDELGLALLEITHVRLAMFFSIVFFSKLAALLLGFGVLTFF